MPGVRKDAPEMDKPLSVRNWTGLGFVHIHGLSVEQSLSSLKTTAEGLSASEAARRLADFGPNHVEEVAREHLFLSFAREFTHFFAIILWKIGRAHV
jgi:magnesium-transporting ATPase (P-type)